jgi:hypothetical protein
VAIRGLAARGGGGEEEEEEEGFIQNIAMGRCE